MINIHGGEAVAKMLKNEGVDTVFGIVDGTYVHFFEYFEKYGIRFITPRHESSAAHMAGAYARSTGKLGVCIASNGPGVAAILSGIAVENAEGNRVMLITSCRRHPISYPERGGTYQYFDQTGVIGPMAKYSEEVPIPERIPEIMKQAFRKSYIGRPGVVHVDVPENYMNGKYKFNEKVFSKPERYRRIEPVKASKADVKTAADMLIKADLPVVHAGSGIIHSMAYPELEKVANLLHSPVTTSWAARGALCETNELSIPLVHIVANNKIRCASDMILTLGSRMGETDWWGKQPYWGDPAEQKMIQVDLDEENIGRNKPADLGIVADVKSFLADLGEELESRKTEIDLKGRKERFAPLRKLVDRDRKKLDKNLENMGSPIHSAHLATIAKKKFGNDSIAVFDGGNTAVWGQMYYKCVAPGFGLGTAKMGMLGAGVGQALGAAAAFPEKPVYCIIGDGAMGYHTQEIETAIRNDLKPIFIVACDKQWGMVKMTQQVTFKPLKTVIKKSLDEGETINGDFGEIQFDKLAESMGGYGERVSSPEELEAAIDRCVKANKCSVIHVDVDPVKHMWAPGLLHFKNMHAEPKGK